jgi:hypothetical protein
MLCGCSLGCFARHRTRTRWHNHSRIGMAFGDLCIDAVLVVPTAGGERGDGIIDLIKQGADLRAFIDVVGRQRRRDVWPLPASTPMCSLRHDRRRLAPCFSTKPAPQRFSPVLSTDRCMGSALDGGRSTANVSARRLGVESSGTAQSDDGSNQSLGLPQRRASARKVSAVVIASAE